MLRIQCMLDDARHSQKYWAFAVSVAVTLKNCTPTQSVVGKTPYEPLYECGRKAPLKHLSVFGRLAFVHGPKEKRKKLGYRATLRIFVRYSISIKQYIVSYSFA
jgi:hypothetical protein